jgi:aminoglycoside phosphotransferase (APT) family kinase protein
MLAALHALPAERIGISAEPELDPADEVSRWTRVFATVDADMQPGADVVARLLNRGLPHAAPARLIHGDFRLGNLLCRDAEPVAIIDWEIWSRGDPRLDLAWFLLTAEPQVHPLAIRDAPGMPRPDVLLAAYQDASGRGIDSLDWFRAAALYKMAASVSLIVKHNRRRGDPDGRAAALAPRVATMLDRARAALDDV